ncbi:twin-arginine translocase subunit TatC [Demequina sp.]|uniref:twin-arginine translocase subunit TatC n=1 Tax=Demequina sp. TaxID=2050685 RepID=UPI003D1332C0
MPLREHLKEFRNRLILASIGILIGAVAGWFLYPYAFDFLAAPIVRATEESGQDAKINFGGLATALDMQVKMSLVIGVIISSPWWLYQLWAFIAPGLRKREKRYTIGFLGAAIPLFLAGVALSLWVYPRAAEILLGFTPEEGSNYLDAQLFMSFAMRLVLAFGIAFIFPVIMVALTAAGLVKSSTWLRGWRWAVMLIFLFTAIMTPTPDAITMIIMAIPMVGLFFAAVGVAKLFERSRKRRKAALAAEEAAAEGAGA